MAPLHLLYPVMHWWTWGLLCLLASVDGAATPLACVRVCCAPCFQFFGDISRNGAAGSYGNAMFNFLRSCQTVFHSSCSTLHLPPPAIEEDSNSSMILPTFSIFPIKKKILRSREGTERERREQRERKLPSAGSLPRACNAVGRPGWGWQLGVRSEAPHCGSRGPAEPSLSPHMGHPAWALHSWVRPDPVLVVMGIQGMNQRMQHLPVSLCLQIK